MPRKKKETAEQISLLDQEEKVLGVSEYLDTLNGYLGGYEATIQGEISRVTERGRAVYFTLLDKEDKSALNCLIWTSQLYARAIELRDGMEVIVSGHPNVYKPTGRLSFMARHIGLVGEGALKAAFEKLKLRLEGEGYFDMARKRPIPPYIRTIGLITAEGREAQKDFLTFLGSYGYKIRFIDVRVEGINALDSIVNAVRWFNENTQDVEALVITRGGGGLESLQAFNTEEIAKAIFSSRIPVISAVGHENDVTICDMVADFRASTPTHAGQYLSQPWRDAEDMVNGFGQNMIAVFRQRLKSARESLGYYRQTMISGFAQHLEHEMRHLDSQSVILMRSFRNVILRVRQIEYRFSAHIGKIAAEIARQKELLRATGAVFNQESVRWFAALQKKIDSLDGQLQQNDPQRRLKQGYSIVTGKGNRIIKSARQTVPDDIITVQTFDGSFHSKVEKQ